jgi:hypothetical protein
LWFGVCLRCFSVRLYVVYRAHVCWLACALDAVESGVFYRKCDEYVGLG